MKQIITRYLLLPALMLSGYAAGAQITANLILNARPPSYLSDWRGGQTGQLIISNQMQGSSTQAILATQLKDASGSVMAVSNNTSAQVYTLPLGNSIIGIDRVLQLENLRFLHTSGSLAASGKLPAGLYTLSVQLLSPAGEILTEVQERMFSQVNYQLPWLLFPADEARLDAYVAQTAITFRWSSLLPASQEIPTYRLQVYEVLEAQTPVQALRSNQPILLVDLRRTTQYIWQPMLPFTNLAVHPFIWTIQTLDSKGNPITGQDETIQGRSEPRTFSVVLRQSNKDTLLGAAGE
jgi:hypothetical protein